MPSRAQIKNISSRSDAAAEPSSEALARAAQDGDQRALNELLSRHKHEAYRVALRVAGNPPDADEILQLALERVLKHLGRYDRERPFRPWLMRIVLNQARSFVTRRSVKRWFFGGGADPAHVPTPEHNPDQERRRRHLREALTAALQTLPHKQREAFVLKHIEGYSFEEIGEMTGETVGSLKVRSHRARRALLLWLSEHRVTLAGLYE